MFLSCVDTKNQEQQNQKILSEIEKSLNEDIFNAWYPLTLDTVYGGFLSDFSYDWESTGTDSLLRVRLDEMLHIVRDKIVSDKSSLFLHLTRDWKSISFKDSSEDVRHANHYFDHLSYGHDVETAFLMLEASHTLGIENDTVTMRISKEMVDNAIDVAWDSKKGGLYYAGYFVGDTDSVELVDSSKSW